MKVRLTRLFKIIFLGVLVSIAGCSNRVKKTDNVEAPEVISEMNKHGIIEHPTKWDNLIKQADYGKKVKTVRELNQILQQGNRHSFATASPQQLEQINYPSISKVKGYQILNVPTFFSSDHRKVKKYQNKLRRLLEELSHKKTLILNFAHNEGGDYYPMISGLSAVIPNGVLWSEINNKGHAKQVVMTNTKIYGGLVGNTYHYSTIHKLNNKKIIILMDSRTGSAAEMTIMALKRGSKVTTIGVPSAGYTSVNTGRVAKSKKSAAILTIGTITSNVEIGEKKHFNNEPLRPDILTLYSPISPAKGDQYKKQQPLDPDFLDELSKRLPN